MTFSLVPERPKDRHSIELLMDRSFGLDRKNRTVYSLREGIHPLHRLSWVAVDPEGFFLGSIRYWPVLVSNKPAILLGPIAVEPALQGRGIGKALINHTLFLARRQGDLACILVGDPNYYKTFGFSSASAAGLVLNGPVELARFQVLELKPGGLEGMRGVLKRDERHAASNSHPNTTDGPK